MIRGCLPVVAAALASGCLPAAQPQAPPSARPAPPVPPPIVHIPPKQQAAPEPLARPDFTVDGRLIEGGWIRGLAPSTTVELTLDGQPIDVAPDGAFFAAFNRDHDADALLRARLADGSYRARELQVADRDWNIEHVNVARRAGGASASFMARRRPELERIAAARAANAASEGWRQEFVWPVTGRISGRFGSQRIYRGEPGSYHSGLDIAGGAGTTYVAPADGVVTLAAEDFSLEGQLLIIDHGNGLNSAFLHSSALLVREGDKVRQGQPLGRIGSSGRATGPHLHWSLKWRDARLDPLLFLPPMP